MDMARSGVKTSCGRVPREKALVIGAGNILLKDEGLGVRAIELFKDIYSVPAGVSAIDGGTACFDLSSSIKGFKYVIIIDAVLSGAPPGTIVKIAGEDLPKDLRFNKTAHQVGIKELMAIAHFEGHYPQVLLIGMVPEDISPGLELSPLVRERLPLITDMIRDALCTFGIKAKKRGRYA